jgi:hypothetical protein
MRVLIVLGALLCLTGCGTGAKSISSNADPYQFAPSATDDHPNRTHKKYKHKITPRHVRVQKPAPPVTVGVVPGPASNNTVAIETPSGTLASPPPNAANRAGPTQAPTPTTPPAVPPPAIEATPANVNDPPTPAEFCQKAMDIFTSSWAKQETKTMALDLLRSGGCREPDPAGPR